MVETHSLGAKDIVPRPTRGMLKAVDAIEVKLMFGIIDTGPMSGAVQKISDGSDARYVI